MDPNVVVDELRKLADEVLADDTNPDPASGKKNYCEVAYQMAIRFDQLDHWLKKGGFIPAVWAKKEELLHPLHALKG